MPLRISQERVNRLDFLQVGDVIFVDALEDFAAVGKSLEITRGVVSGLHTIAARFDKTVLVDGFKGYLQFIPDFRRQLLRLATGTKVYAIQRSHIASIALERPAVEEQRAIAAVLVDMDAEIAALESRREKVRQVKQGMMQVLLTGKVRLVQDKSQ
jgi:type I restriction enzyme S subunit